MVQNEHAYAVLVGHPKGHRWTEEAGVKWSISQIGLTEIGHEGVDRHHVSHNKDKWWALSFETVLNRRVSQNVGSSCLRIYQPPTLFLVVSHVLTITTITSLNSIVSL